MNIPALAQLNSFTGTDHYYKAGPLFPGLVYTDGVAHLLENADAYWLMDAIGSYQPECKKDPRLQQMQFWTLRMEQSKAPATLGEQIAEKRGETPHMATLICERDTDDVAFTQKIEFTDFPFQAFPNGEVKIWVAPTGIEGKPVMVAYLPSEH